MKEIAKYMTRWVAIAVALLAISCSAGYPSLDAPPADKEFMTAFGMFLKESGQIVADDGVVMDIYSCGPQVSWSELERRAEAADGRIFFNYSVQEVISEERCCIVINRLYDLFVEEVGIIDENTEDGVVQKILSLQPAMPYQASYSGGYINIRVYYPSTISPSVGRPHMALDCNLLDSKLPSIGFYLSHKAAEGDDIYSESAYLRDAWFSFRASDELQEVLAQAELFVFRWCWWRNDGDHSQGYDTMHNSTLVISPEDGVERTVELF